MKSSSVSGMIIVNDTASSHLCAVLRREKSSFSLADLCTLLKGLFILSQRCLLFCDSKVILQLVKSMQCSWIIWVGNCHIVCREDRM